MISKKDVCLGDSLRPWIKFSLLIKKRKKDVYSKSYLMQKGHRTGQRLEKWKWTNKKKLITKERTKEQRERITRGESKSPRPVKKGTTKRSKQVIGAFHVLFHKKNPFSKVLFVDGERRNKLWGTYHHSLLVPPQKLCEIWIDD